MTYVSDRLLQRFERLTTAAEDLATTRPGSLDRKHAIDRVHSAYRGVILDPDWAPVMNDSSAIDREDDPFFLISALRIEDGERASASVRGMVTRMLEAAEAVYRLRGDHKPPSTLAASPIGLEDGLALLTAAVSQFLGAGPGSSRIARAESFVHVGMALNDVRTELERIGAAPEVREFEAALNRLLEADESPTPDHVLAVTEALSDLAEKGLSAGTEVDEDAFVAAFPERFHLVADEMAVVADLSATPTDLAVEMMAALDELHRALGGGGLEIRESQIGTTADVAVPA